MYCSADKIPEIKKSLKNVVLFEKHKVKPERKITSRSKKTHLSLNEKRKLGLYKLSRKVLGLNYENFLDLNNLWRQYFLDSMDFSMFKNKKGTVNVSDKQWEQLSAQLYKADYHGAELTVTRAKCPSLVGTRGIVLMDTKNTFRLIATDNIIRTIPKESCVFKLHLQNFSLTLYGRHLCIKPAERSTKKIRSNLSVDL
ncbi:ribonuclease P protein subunit p29 isoform X2 [Macrosteles quadrilineatus]|nr:ribonuclease P protein subunit p29 isoform X2 [Macrosteles quadrilineatus]